jgi:hypothetical protein
MKTEGYSFQEPSWTVREPSGGQLLPRLPKAVQRTPGGRKSASPVPVSWSPWGCRQ